ncbi:MAG: 2,3-bisphosphoglycerate-independent phosphoglycerate mutase [Candidatus Nanohaloarchaea archaeon]
MNPQLLNIGKQLRFMKPVLLVVMDGVGLRDEKEGNAFLQADTPNLDRLMEEKGYQKLEASEEAVGLPEGYTGNSEVGHLHLGAGRRIPQRLKRINEAIEENRLRGKEALRDSLERAEENTTAVHLAGIISDGGIHGHIDHLKALLEITEDYDIDQVWIHCFTDGRDVDPKSAKKYLQQIEDFKPENADIATVMGRYYSMDRDENWGRTHKAYQAMAETEGFQFSHPEEAVEKCYNGGDYDYFIQPSVSENYRGMKDEDELIFYNFRADRERQIEEEMVAEADPDKFEEPVNPNFVSMFPYEQQLDVPSIFDKKIVENTLGEKIEEAGYSQLRVAESQKKPHVTYFFNGQRELEFEHEERKFIESDKIKAYDQKPEMHADEITNIVLEAMEKGEHEFILLNYANCDLVGHTGEIEAVKTAVETVDRNIGRLIEKLEETGYIGLITADHGNCEDLGTEESPKTSHTLNPVPLIGVGTEPEIEEGELWNIEEIAEQELDV